MDTASYSLHLGSITTILKLLTDIENVALLFGQLHVCVHWGMQIYTRSVKKILFPYPQMVFREDTAPAPRWVFEEYWSPIQISLSHILGFDDSNLTFPRGALNIIIIFWNYIKGQRSKIRSEVRSGQVKGHFVLFINNTCPLFLPGRGVWLLTPKVYLVSGVVSSFCLCLYFCYCIHSSCDPHPWPMYKGLIHG